MPQRSLIAGVTLLLILIWGTTWAAIRIGLEGIPPYAGVGIRFALAAVILFALARLAGVPSQRGPVLYRIWIVETAFAFCLSYGVVYWAEQWVPSGLASIIFATMPLFVAIFAHFWLDDEPFRSAQVTGIAIGFAGVTVIFSDELGLASGRDVLVPALVFLLSPISAAIAHVYVKKWGRGIHPLNIVIVPMALTGVVMAGISLMVESGRALDFGVRPLAALLYMTILGTVVTFPLYYWVLERIAATRLSLMTLAIPVVAVLVGTLVMGEPFSIKTALGSGLVLIGVGVAGRG